jgi:hypothetical protein
MFQFAYRGTQGTARIKLLPVAAGQLLSKGEPVSINAGLVVAGAPAATNFVGVMNQNANNLSAGTLVEVILCDADTVFYADAVGGDFTDADIGSAFDLNAADNTKVDKTDSLDGAWVIVGYDNNEDKVWVKCLPAKRHALAD